MRYKRILLKISGEALAGENRFGIDHEVTERICEAVKATYDLGVQIGIVIGAGNFWRGRDSVGIDRAKADQMGMIATVMNSVAVGNILQEQYGLEVRVMTAINMPQVAEPYIISRARRHLEKGRVIILAGGTGNPFFSTDSGAALRAAEINADIIFKATQVDGVYDKDPHKFEDAKKFDEISFTTVLSEKLAVIDGTAASLCRDNNIPILVFNINDPLNIRRAAEGENIGTVIKEDI